MIALYIVIAVILWASSFVGIRAALIDYSPVEIAVMRFAVSSVTLLPMIHFRRLKLPDKKDGLSLAVLGLVLFFNQIALNYGTRTITAGETTLIISTSQLFQVLLAYLFLKEAISKRFLLGLFFCFIGVTILAMQNSIGLSLNPGIVFVLIAAVTNAIFFILQKSLLTKYSPLEVISYSTWIAALMLLPLGKGVTKVISEAGFSSTAAVLFVGLAIVLANICWSSILARIDASKAAIFLYTVPVVTIIIGFIWLGELPSLISSLGGAVIICGVILASWKLPVASR